MTQRRNFHPSDSPAEYEHKHIKFRAMVEVDLHNVGDEFELTSAVEWLSGAIERGLKSADPNDTAQVVENSASLLSRPDCRCYEGCEVETL